MKDGANALLSQPRYDTKTLCMKQASGQTKLASSDSTSKPTQRCRGFSLNKQQQCNTNFKNDSRRKVRLMHLNVRSLKCKVLETKVLLANQRPDIFCATEHWCNEKEIRKVSVDSCMHISSYCRKENRGGGTAIYARHGFQLNPITR
ncbi:hypothetical protein JTB14_035400 [Gonioctena quinquepunctata]|nr:hypothetical protein JTB14_035400 [Gonioctena quinquepunctata]